VHHCESPRVLSFKLNDDVFIPFDFTQKAGPVNVTQVEYRLAKNSGRCLNTIPPGYTRDGGIVAGLLTIDPSPLEKVR